MKLDWKDNGNAYLPMVAKSNWYDNEDGSKILPHYNQHLSPLIGWGGNYSLGLGLISAPPLAAQMQLNPYSPVPFIHLSMYGYEIGTSL